MTLGQAIDAYLPMVVAQGYRPSTETEHRTAVARHVPWTVFRLSTPGPVSLDPAGLAPATPGTQRARRQVWRRLERFREAAPVRHLTWEVALAAFLETVPPRSRQPVWSGLCVMGRALAREQELAAIPAGLWRRVAAPRRPERRQAVRRFLLWLQDEDLISFEVVPPRPQRRWLRELEEQIRQAPRSLSPGFGWEGAVAAYLRSERDGRGVGSESLHNTWACLRHCGGWLAARGLRLVDVNQSEALAYLASEEARGLGVRALRERALHLRRFFAFLADNGVCVSNPLGALRVRAEHRPPPVTAPAEAILERLIGAARGRLADGLARGATTRRQRQELLVLYRDVALLETLCGTGLRPSEVCRLRVADLDTRFGRLRVRGKGSMRTSLRERVLDLPAARLRQALADHLNAWQPSPEAPLFASSRGGPLTPEGLGNVVDRHRRAAGITARLAPQDLRRGFASSLVARGADPLTVQALMGHATPRTALQHYVALEERQLREVWLRTNPLSRLEAHRKEGAGDGTPRTGD